MQLNKALCAVVALAGVSTLVAGIDPALGLYNTGTGTPGTQDSHYKVSESPVKTDVGQAAYIVNANTYPNVAGTWVQADNAKWISANLDGSSASAALKKNTFYDYETSFTIPANYDLSAMKLKGLWAADNEGYKITLNGVTFENTTAQPGYGSLTWFEVTGSEDPVENAFVHGLNTLKFSVKDYQMKVPGNFTGLLVEFTEAGLTPVPEASTYLAGIGAVGLMLSAFWRTRKA